MVKNIVYFIIGVMAVFMIRPLQIMAAEGNMTAETDGKLSIGIEAPHAILMEASTGMILYEKEANVSVSPASVTKIMTMLLIFEALEENKIKLEDTVVVSEKAASMGGSQVFLESGEKQTVDTMLKCIAIASANDACVAMAEYVSGSEEAFVKQMNERAKSLGMKNTHFVNPNGLDAPEHFSTARDLALLASYAMKNPVFAQTVSTKTVSFGNRILRNHNKLLWLVEGADGVKTGFTKAAGRILVSSAVRDDRRLIAVTLNAPSDWRDHSVLLNEGFERYCVRNVVRKDQLVGTVEVEGGENCRVQLLAAEDFDYSLAEEERPQLMIPGTGFVYAPVTKGAEAGFAYVLIDGNAVGKVPLVYGKTIEQRLTEEKGFFEKLFAGK